MEEKTKKRSYLSLFMIILMLLVPSLTFLSLMIANEDFKGKSPYMESFNETTDTVSYAMYKSYQIMYDQVVEEEQWDGVDVAYYTDPETKEVNNNIWFQIVPMDLKFTQGRTGHYLVSRYGNNGRVRYNINKSRVSQTYSGPTEVGSVYWMSEKTIFYSSYTVYMESYPFGTSTFLAFPEFLPTIAFNAEDTMYNYNLYYNCSSTSNIYNRGWNDALIYESYFNAIKTGDRNNVVRYQYPVQVRNIEYTFSNYQDTPDVLLLEKVNDVNDEYIVDLRETSLINPPVYYTSEEDFINQENANSIEIDTVYDYMEMLGINDLMDALTGYIEDTLGELSLWAKMWVNIIVDEISDYHIDILDEILSSFTPDFIVDAYDAIKDAIVESSIDEINALSTASSIEFINRVQNNGEVNSNVSLIETQQWMYSKVIQQFFVNSIDEKDMKRIVQNRDFELEIKFKNDIIYFYTSKDKEEYFGYDLYSRKLFTPLIKGMHRH